MGGSPWCGEGTVTWAPGAPPRRAGSAGETSRSLTSTPRDRALSLRGAVVFWGGLPSPPPQHGFAAVAQLLRYGEQADRRALVEGLQPGGAVGVPEHLRPNLSRFPAGPHRDHVQQLAEVGQHRLFARAV